MDPNLRAAVLAVDNTNIPASPLGASQAPQLADLYRSSFQLPISSGVTSAAVNTASDQVKAQSQKTLSDIKNYQIVKQPDGGFNYYDPSGKQVDIASVSQNTGVDQSTLLKGSKNPIDIQYIQDYKDLNGFLDAASSGNVAKVNEYKRAAQAAGLDLSKYADTKGGLHQLITDFQNSYQRYYVPRDVNPQAWGANIPTAPLLPAPVSSQQLLQNKIDAAQLKSSKGKASAGKVAG